MWCLSPRNRTVVPDDFCDIVKKPPSKRNCFIRNCGNYIIEHVVRDYVALFIEGMCQRDESGICPLLAIMMRCDSDLAMGDNGLRCCVSCMGMAGGD